MKSDQKSAGMRTFSYNLVLASIRTVKLRVVLLIVFVIKQEWKKLHDLLAKSNDHFVLLKKNYFLISVAQSL